MTCTMKAAPAAISGDTVVATALNGVVYTENNRLHVKTNNRHVLYKHDGNPAGWYARNIKTNDDIYLGDGASPSVELESVDIKNTDAWAGIIAPETPDEESVGDIEE